MPGARMRRRKKLRDERAQMAGGEEEQASNQLFGDDDDDDDGDNLSLKVNEKFKDRFEHNEKLKDRMRLKELENEGIETESSGTDEDEEAQLLTEEMDLAIMDTIARIKKKDPRIYDSKAKFFEDFKEEEEEEGKEGVKKEKKEKKEKKFTVTDMAREMILKGKDGANSDEDEEEEGEMGYYEEQDKLKRMFKDSKEADKEEDGSDDDLFVPRKKGRDEKIKDDREYEEFARDRLAEKNPTQTLATLLKDENLDQEELWLRQYVLGNEWKKEDEALPTYGQIVGDESEEDEEHIKLQEDYEEVYNHRFEQAGSDQIVGHSRSIEGSVRREESKRKEKRMKKASRAAEEMEQKREELKRLKNQKKLEIYERLKKIQELSKAKDVGSEKIDLEADFDPEEHDRKMAEIYDEEYYGEEEAEHPFAGEAGEDFLAEIGYEDEDEDEEYWEEEGEEEVAKPKGRKMSKKEERQAARDAARAEKKKGKNVSEAELEATAKATGMDKYLEEYYNLDYEGMIGDTPTRFKYRETEAVDVGLTPEEILMLDDKDLRQCMPIAYFGAPFRGNMPPKLLKKLKQKAKQAKKELWGDDYEGGGGEEGGEKKKKKREREREEEEEEEEEEERERGQEEEKKEGEEEEEGGGGKEKKKGKKGKVKRDKWGNKISGGDGGGDARDGGEEASEKKKEKKKEKKGPKRDKWGNIVAGGEHWRDKKKGGVSNDGGGIRKKEGWGKPREEPGWKKAGVEEDRFASYGIGKKSEKKEGERDAKKAKYDKAHKLHAGEGGKPREKERFRGDGESGGGWQKVTKFDDD